MDHSAETINQFAAVGCGEIAYLKLLFCEDVLALAPGADINPGQFCFALVGADGDPILLRGSIAACVIEAQERGLTVAAVH